MGRRDRMQTPQPRGCGERCYGCGFAIRFTLRMPLPLLASFTVRSTTCMRVFGWQADCAEPQQASEDMTNANGGQIPFLSSS